MVQKDFDRLLELDKEIAMLSNIMSVLSWDKEMGIPEKAQEGRGEQLSYLASRVYEIETSHEMGDLLSKLGASASNREGDGRDDFEKGLIRTRFNAYSRMTLLPPELVQAQAKATNDGYYAWKNAIKENDFSLFEKALDDNIALAREEASCLSPDGGRYDALLDKYEEGCSTKILDKLFGDAADSISDIVKRYGNIDVRDSFLYVKYEEDKLDAFSNSVIKDIGFDFSRGKVSLAAHPFTDMMGPNDIRITTRYTDPSVMDPIASTIHEGGHAMYMMGASKGRLAGTTMGDGASMGFHESQSRFWENIIAKSEPFWEYYYPKFSGIFRKQLDGVTLNDFVKAINRVTPSYVRVNADETTYTLHVILRYFMEKEMIDGDLKAKDVPERWNSLFREMLGIEVRDDREGCLQDIHWSAPEMGYFPTYALGNFYGAQILDTLYTHFGSRESFDDLIRTGRSCVIREYLEENIYSKGSMYTPMDLIRRVTGRELEGHYFIDYLERKLKGIYY